MLFGPVLRFLGRLRVSRKLMLIFLLDMSAVAYISGILVDEKFIAIDFARKELAGNAYIDDLRPALLAAASAVADGGAVPAEVGEAVTQAEQRHGDGLRSDGLSRDFQQRVRDTTLAAAPAAAAPALAAGRALVTRVGNQSNLILDPDLDSYYTMSIILLRLPELLQAAAEVAAHQLRRDAADAPPLAAFLLLEGRLDAAWHGLDADHREAYAAGQPTLRDALEPSRAQLQQAFDAFRRAAREAMDATGAGRAPDVQALRTAHGELQQRLDAAWRSAGVTLKGLLEARIDGFFHRMALHLGTALALLLLILSAVFFVARQIAVPLQRLAGVADAVRRSGDRSLRAHWSSSDEIGRLVHAFNDMLGELDRERAAQQELAARARAAQAQSQLVEAIPIPLMVTAIPGHQVLHANGPARAWLGASDDDPWRRGLDTALRLRFFQQLADHGAVDEFEVRWRAGDERPWAVLSARRLEFQGQDAVLTAFTPVNHLKLMERRLELWAKVFEASSEGILIVDADRRVLTANRALCRSLGYELHELVGERLGDEAGPSLAGAFAEVLAQSGPWQGETVLQRRDGSRFPAWMMLSVVREGSQGQVAHSIATVIDITDRKRNEERIRFLAQHDVLTELPNRALCVERLRMAMQQAERRGEKVAVLFIDLDRFKNINDSLGHHVGDALLKSVAQRLSESVRAGDTVSRLGGDEFVVVLAGIADAAEAASIVEERLVPRVRAPHGLAGAELQVSCSVGIAVYPDDSRDLDTLMRHADAAMYQAKSMGRDAAQFFSSELNERAQRRLQLESGLRQALERHELSLHYQPRMDASGARLVGVEALLRWQSAELGSVPPSQFIAIAEETRLIVPIGTWVIEQACAQLAAWRRDGLEVPQVSVNVSALQLRDDGLVETLRDALETHALPPGAVELELTESALMDRQTATLDRLHAIKRLGVELAIDDFGTGYSSLNYLNRFPIDRLKIDRSFVHSMCADPVDLAITRAIIGLGHALRLKVVAEGVESEREVQTLRALGCDELQGYLIARPMAAALFGEWVARPRLRRQA